MPDWNIVRASIQRLLMRRPRTLMESFQMGSSLGTDAMIGWDPPPEVITVRCGMCGKEQSGMGNPTAVGELLKACGWEAVGEGRMVCSKECVARMGRMP